MVQIKETISGLKMALADLRAEGKRIGFVPTMGALHDGHLQLVSNARKENDIVVVSVFVNPIQFNNREDLKKYPRDLDGDIRKLEAVHTDFVFAPKVEEMYPDKVSKKYDFGRLGGVMEGKFRPGHFNGVAVVVHRLFDIVEPDSAYFGEKDFQQLAIIRKLVEMENIPVEVIGNETIRESDGLAMSSRNQRLTPEQRKKAPLIYQTLNEAVKQSKSEPVETVKQKAVNKLEESGFDVEYFEIVDGKTLQPLSKWADSKIPRACVAAYLGNVRLIDNIAF